MPDLDQNSKKLPERDFFFGVLSTLKKEYLKKIIKDAHEVRIKGDEEEKKNQCIMIKDHWLEELRKYPFISSIIQYL